jgi:hypothetical protein
LDAAESVFHENVPLSWWAVPFSFCFSWMDNEINATMRMNPERAFFYLRNKGIFQVFEEDVKTQLGYKKTWPTEKFTEAEKLTEYEKDVGTEGKKQLEQLIFVPLMTFADLLDLTKGFKIDVFFRLKELCEAKEFDKELVDCVINKMKDFIASESAAQAKSDVSAKVKAAAEAKAAEEKSERDAVFYYRLRYYLCYLFEQEFVNNENYHLLMKDFPEEDKAAKEVEEKKKEEKEKKAKRKEEKQEKEKAEGGGAKK